MKLWQILLGIIVLIVLGVLVFKPRLGKIGSVDEFETYLDQMVKGNNPPGVSVVVVKDGQIIYQYATGLADGPNGVPVTNDTVYHWWSMTKMATAVGIMQLSEQGLLDIDAPVTDYLPYFAIEYGKYEGPVTIRQLLRHTSGLPDAVPDIFSWVHYEDVVYDQTELVRQYMPEFNTLKYQPDSKGAYTNFGYMVLGAVIAEVSGMPYEDYIVEYVLEPAQLQNTGFVYTAEMAPYEAVGSHPVLNIMTPVIMMVTDFDAMVRQRDGMTYWLKRLYIDVLPSTGLIGPADDGARLLIAMQTPGVLLSAESLEMMMPTGKEPTERPLGWAEYEMGENMWVQHSGGGAGFATQMRYYPAQDLGIIIMGNGTNLDRNGLANAAAKVFGE